MLTEINPKKTHDINYGIDMAYVLGRAQLLATPWTIDCRVPRPKFSGKGAGWVVISSYRDSS